MRAVYLILIKPDKREREMMKSNYWTEMYGKQTPDFIKGVIAGITMFAWWKDGVQEVGTTGTTLKKAIKDAEEGLG